MTGSFLKNWALENGKSPADIASLTKTTETTVRRWYKRDTLRESTVLLLKHAGVDFTPVAEGIERAKRQ